MLRDVFYYGKKPNVHPREKFAENLQDARNKCVTEHFWIVNEFCDYKNFDWDFDFDYLPDDEVWTQEHNNVWPSVHQKDSGTWLCSKQDSDVIIYRNDVTPLKRFNIVTENWNLLDNIDKSKFDFSWHPDPTDPPYIYKWGCKYFPVEVKHVLEYVVPNATQEKFMEATIELLPQTDRWEILYENIDKSKFDFSWRPDPREPAYIYVFGNNIYDAVKMPTIQYVTPGATEKKYIHYIVVKLLSNKERFQHFENCVLSDYSWIPDPDSPPYIYVWGNQWHTPEEKISVQYVVEGATEYKYMDERATRLPSLDNWIIPNDIDVSLFDFSWEPHVNDPPYIYQFGTQHQKTGGPRYVPSNSDQNTPIKYVDTSILKAKKLPNKDKFVILNNYKIKEFDYSWHPDDTEEPYIYVFGNNHYSSEVMPIIEYRMENATQVKYVYDVVAILDNSKYWIIPNDVSILEFDFSWVPNPNDPPYIYQFGTQHQKTGGPKYIVDNATDIKYVEKHVQYCKKLPNKNNWTNPYNSDITNFDFSWHPDDTEPMYIYQFGTLIDRNDGPRYTPNNVQDDTVVYLPRVEINQIKIQKYYIETTLENLVKQHPNEVFWALNKNIDYTNFDFDWRPEVVLNEWESNYVHVFGSSESELTHTYFVNAKSYINGNTDYKFVENSELSNNYLSNLFVKPDMFFIDHGNIQTEENYQFIKSKFNNVQKTRYLNSYVDTINRCIKRSSTKVCWILDSRLDYTNFNFDYYPNPWQITMIHIFGTQFNKWGTTYLINCETFPNDTKYVKVIEHLKNLNFVKDNRATATNCLYDIVLIDHGNNETNDVYTLLKTKTPNVNVSLVKFDNSYLKTFKNFIYTLPQKKEHYIWVCSSVCDYSKFDFAYIPDPFAKDQLHVFPSQQQKYGDTFLIDVNKTTQLLETLETLENYIKINYNNYQRVPRIKPPVIITEDSNTDVIKTEFNFPYCVCITEDNKDIHVVDNEPISLWSIDKRNILITSSGGTRLIVPKDVKEYVTKELYDYPYISKSSKLSHSKPLDIVFLSNSEKCADENYEHLLKVTHGLENRVVRVDGVNGRVNAYHRAADVSNTPWFFTVFAKLKIDTKFDFNWQPDRLQIPKHYIFYALNPVNKLVYGHQGMIAYNKKLVLANNGLGLDFTLDDPHEVIELLSGTANYNTDEFSAWRTAFREVIKLRADNSFIARHRIKAWLSEGMGDYREYSQRGAYDALDYYDLVNGDFIKLKLSYEWEWLKKHYQNRCGCGIAQ